MYEVAESAANGKTVFFVEEFLLRKIHEAVIYSDIGGGSCARDSTTR
jgi:hypothetical protein